MPKESLVSIEELHLPNNKIAYLHQSSSYFEGLTGLKYLNLQHNRLQSVGSRTFSALSSLERLNLADNALYAIQKDDFEGLSILQHLDLTGNKMRLIENGALDGVKNLRGLFLSNNWLDRLDDIFDNGGSQLEHLSIANLNISCLEPSWFLKFRKLKWIYATDTLAFFMDSPLDATLQQQLQRATIHPWSGMQHCDESMEFFQRETERSTQSTAFLRIPVRDTADVVFQNILANFVTCFKTQSSPIRKVISDTICPTRL